MTQITNISDLRKALQDLEDKREKEWPLLKEQLLHAYENIKPTRLIKSALNELAIEPDLKGDVLNTSVSLAAGFISKKIMVGASRNPIKRLLGTFLQIGVTRYVAKNAESIKSATMQMLNNADDEKEKDSK